MKASNRCDPIGPTPGADSRDLLKHLDLRVALPETKHLLSGLLPGPNRLIQKPVKPLELAGHLRLGDLLQVASSAFLGVGLLALQVQHAPAAKDRLDLLL